MCTLPVGLEQALSFHAYGFAGGDEVARMVLLKVHGAASELEPRLVMSSVSWTAWDVQTPPLSH